MKIQSSESLEDSPVDDGVQSWDFSSSPLIKEAGFLRAASSAREHLSFQKKQDGMESLIIYERNEER